ncbi:MAG TPA: ABC transporter substrate-binding protein [Casimicrobiaceae bacterium]|nr:ABC transporter substrate-binding protein [Casimicrobiaceae bacterium]
MNRRNFLRATAAATAAAALPARTADAGKVLRTAFPVAETGFDPQATSDLYSDGIQRAIFETLYGFDYLARPYKRVPRTAAALPEIADGGRTWTMRVRPGIHFAHDPVFKGRKRELTAADYVYSWKRLLDPHVRSPFAWYVQGKIVGAEGVIEAANNNGGFDYDARIEGLRALDRYTLRLALKEPDYIMLGYLTQSPMAAVAREVVEAYGDANGWVMDHPVGTGAYRLGPWRRGQQIVLEANPDYREETFPDSADPADRELVDEMRGKRLPIVGRVEVSIIEESNPRLLAFDSGALDYVNVPSELSDTVLDDAGRLRAAYADRGVKLGRITQPALQYAYFNMEDPVVGGYSKEKIALRRAISMGFNRPEMIRVVYQGQALPATQPIPPNLPGHDDHWNVALEYDPRAANALLDRFGYKDRDGDGWRELPDGKPFTVVMASATAARDREFDELWQKSMKAIGVRMEFLKQKFPDLIKMGRAGKLQMWRVGWITVYGEGDAFAQLLYGPNIGQTNYARFSLPEYDELYRASRRLPDGPERNKLYRRMSELVAAYNPWWLGFYTIENTLVQPWVRGYKKHAYWEHPWKYLDLAEKRGQAGR